MNVTLLVFMLVSIGLLFTSMVLSAMASSDAKKAENSSNTSMTNSLIGKAQKYSMWAALVTGLSTFVIIVVAIVYIYVSRKTIARGVAGVAHNVGDFFDT
jgi:ABC-type Fe3+ transport system permease subunit